METGIYTALTGLHAFSRGLDNISSNVSNMNTTGYKRQGLLFRDSYYRDMTSNGQLCLGVAIGGSATNYQQGELQSTGKSTEIAIKGQGYFVLQQNGTYMVTRSGQFDFNEDYVLAETASGALVMGWSPGGGLQPIDISEQRVNPYAATTSVDLTGILSTNGSVHTLSDIEVYDSVGGKHVLSAVFTRNSGATNETWSVEIRNESGVGIATGELRFNANGSPMTGYNSVAVTHSYTGGETLSLTLNAGTPGVFSGAYAEPRGTTSTLKVGEVDGHATGGLSSMEVDIDGYLVLTYSNGEELRVTQVAVGLVDDQSALRSLGGGLFDCEGVVLDAGAPGEGGRGQLVGGSVELSNVDLTTEFTEMIVIQRGYQAASQVITAANEMLQQLIEMTKTK